ncbi:hypothetical protein EW125_17605, partial [Vibrio cholerae]|nr:hypothetical protein [Vibrio cholerae]
IKINFKDYRDLIFQFVLLPKNSAIDIFINMRLILLPKLENKTPPFIDEMNVSSTIKSDLTRSSL